MTVGADELARRLRIDLAMPFENLPKKTQNCC